MDKQTISTVKLKSNDHPWDSKIVAVFVDRWSLFRGDLFIKSSKWDLKMVVVIDRWSHFGGGCLELGFTVLPKCIVWVKVMWQRSVVQPCSHDDKRFDCGDRQLLKNELLMINKLHILQILTKVETEEPLSPQLWQMLRQWEFGLTPLPQTLSLTKKSLWYS